MHSVAVEPVAVVEEAPVVVEIPVAPVKRTRKRKSDVVEAPVEAPVEEPVAEVSPEA
jgi:ribonuclease E